MIDRAVPSGCDVSIAASSDHAMVVSVHGEVDACSAGLLEGCVADLSEQTDEVVIDLRDVDFLDAAGVRALLSCADQVAEHGGHLRLRAPSQLASRVLTICRLDEVLEIESWSRSGPTAQAGQSRQVGRVEPLGAGAVLRAASRPSADAPRRGDTAPARVLPFREHSNVAPRRRRAD